MSPPRDCGVVYGSTPVVSFGDFTKARVATIGINPSSLEFMDKSASGTSNSLLPEGKKRLADAESLGLISDDELDDDTAEYYLGSSGAREIWESCRDYFEGPNAYWSWFSDLESVLSGLSASYKDSSACHLDLSPWATFPAFRDLTKAQKDNLLDHDKELLPWLLGNSSIKTLILNGRFVYETVKSTNQIKLEQVGAFEYLAGGRKNTSELIMGESSDGQLVLGWTLNLQSMQTSEPEREFVMSELTTWLQDKIVK